MTEDLLRAALRLAVERSYGAGFGDAVTCQTIPMPPARRAARRAVSLMLLAEAAEDLVLPVVAGLVQEALEQGFDGRADAEPPPCG